MPLRRRDIETLLAPEYLEGIALASVEEVRHRRDECQRAEIVVSYLRRVIQGALDLVIAEVELRAAGVPGDASRLVDELPAILGAWPSVSVSPDEVTLHFAVRPGAAVPKWWGNEDALLEDLIAGALDSELAGTNLVRGALPGANLVTFTDSELAQLVDRLRDDEASLSAQRRQLHERIDLLQASIVERYKSGAASVDALLAVDTARPPASPEQAVDEAPST